MNEATNNQQLAKNKRSFSLLSQQNSKRSSVSEVYDQLTNNNYINSLNVSSIKKQPICQSSKDSNISLQPFQQYNHKQQFNIALISEQILQKMKLMLIEPYRVIKKHYKEAIFVFQEQQLKKVYNSLSNSLKSIQSHIATVKKASIKDEQIFVKRQKQRMKSSFGLAKSVSDSEQPNFKQGNSIINSFLSISESISQNVSSYIQKITFLQGQMQSLRQKGSQQIRLMIQNHEEEMMFFQTQQSKRLSQIKRQHERQIDLILQTHKSRQQEIRCQSSKKLTEQFKSKLQALKREESLKLQERTAEFKEKQLKYKQVIEKLLQRLKQAQHILHNLQQENQQKVKVVQQYVKRVKQIILSSQKQNQKHNVNSSNGLFLKTLLEKLTSINSSNITLQSSEKNSKNQNNKLQNNEKGYKKSLVDSTKNVKLQNCTLAIDQMFDKNDEELENERHNLEELLQILLERLICCGFFTEENQQNIANLINISKESKYEAQFQPELVLSHALYPLILQKIKLTICSRISHNQAVFTHNPHKSQFFNNHYQPHQFSQKCPQLSQFEPFSSSKYRKTQNKEHPPIKLRNIQSIQELQVSDSLIDENNLQIQKKVDQNHHFESNQPEYEDNFDKESRGYKFKREIIDDEDLYHSPIVNYKGYQTPQENEHQFDESSSFDIDNF